MSKTNIEWSNEVWNPTTGCTKVSPGCAHCYAETLTQRYAGRPGWPAEFKPWTPANAAENVVLHPDRLEAPLSWRTPRRVFVNSMSDLFHENISDDFRDAVFDVMQLARQHQFQILTKRPEIMRAYIMRRTKENQAAAAAWSTADRKDYRPSWPLSNVWLGVTVENQRWADKRIPILLDTPAAVRFVSAEPLLGPVSFLHMDVEGKADGMYWINALTGRNTDMGRPCPDVPRIDWIIIGGESGPKHRPFNPDWARSIVAQCAEAGVAVFMKQMGGTRPGTRLEDLPVDLQIREFPDANR